jgi:hypothetical protein
MACYEMSAGIEIVFYLRDIVCQSRNKSHPGNPDGLHNPHNPSFDWYKHPENLS